MLTDEDKAWLNKVANPCSWIESPKGIIVQGSVLISPKDKINVLQVCFNTVVGNFICRSNTLNSLINFPVFVGGNFDCSENNLSCLNHMPAYIGGSFNCTGNLNLKSLWGIRYVKGRTSLNCQNCKKYYPTDNCPLCQFNKKLVEIAKTAKTPCEICNEMHHASIINPSFVEFLPWEEQNLYREENPGLDETNHCM